MSQKKKHVARSGAKAGQWVNCTAKTQCTLGGLHITEQQLYSTAAQLIHDKKPKRMQDISLDDVQNHLKNPERNTPEWNEKVRQLALKNKGIKDPTGTWNPFEEYNFQIKAVKELELKMKQDAAYNKKRNVVTAKVVAKPQPSGIKFMRFTEQVKLYASTFESYKIAVIQEGGDLKYDEATILKYSDGRPDEIEIKGLYVLSKSSTLNSIKKTVNEEHKLFSSRRLFTVSMKSKDFDNLMKTVDADEEITVYPQSMNVESKSFGRKTIHAQFEIQSTNNKVDQIWKTLPKGPKELSSSNFLKPEKLGYKEKISDPEEKKHLYALYRSLKTASDNVNGSDNVLSYDDKHFLDRAQSSYIPEIVDAYSEIKESSTVSVEHKKQAQKIFIQQIDIISNKLKEISEKKSQTALRAMSVNLGFLEDRTM